ncbi:MAG TPA: CHRD domain-containing protein [Gaiellaceae bacterium]|nr:CHRD domain-containing protein [Gaiellaceae bacterium]
MRKLLLWVVPLFAASFGLADAARDTSFAKTAVCDLTSSKTKPYQRVIATSPAALRRYTAKPADIVPAPRSCPKTLLTTTTGGVGITAEMVGVTELPDLGDPDGTGVATIRVRKGEGQVCAQITVKNISAPTAAHIHKGTSDDSGPVVVPLKTPSATGASGGCVPAPRAVVNDLLANRAGYYVNVHTADFPGGALRAQLNGPVAFVLQASMVGANEKPNAGDPDGTGLGEFILRPDKGQLCYTLAASNIVLPASASHIHRGDATVAGPVVIPFTAPGANGTSSACVTVDSGLLKEIIANPGGFYANIHTTDFPGGAVRAPLAVLS